jgi:hypothetical protein
MTPIQKHYFALSDWLDRMAFILICLDDETISDYFKENLFQPMATLMVLESEAIMQLELEAYKDGLKAV